MNAPSLVRQSDSSKATIAYVAPFAAFVAVMALEHTVAPQSQLFYPLRLLIVSAVLLLFSRPYITLRTSFPLASIGIGIAVFLIWIGPDRLFGYRHFWLFDNALTGSASSSISPALKDSALFLTLRAIGSVALVPIIEELFWRGWLMRWVIDNDFLKVPLGKYAPRAFWIVAILFASEHGPYWEVGLAAGIVYNWWLIRTKNLADCILAHAVTNGILAAYVVVSGRWEYWL
jgi:CAAX prenyl protease-like protein